MAKGIKKMIYKAQKKVNKEISGFALEGGRFGGALAGEGYSGGYKDALSDVILALNGNVPRRRDYWD